MNIKILLNVVAKIMMIVTILYVFGHLFISQNYWSGVYYPGGNTSGPSIYSPRFDTKEECIGWAVNEQGLRPQDKSVPLQDLWECNKNCKISGDYANLIRYSQKSILETNRGPLYFCDDGGFDGGDWLNGNF